jgi:DNA-binding NarL/FixJ family response regulator
MVLVAGGFADKEIALRLGLSVATVRTHLQRLYRDIGAHSRALAVATWLERGRYERPSA